MISKTTLKTISIGFLTLATLVACGDSNQDKALADAASIPVKVSTVGFDTGGGSFYASGTVEAVQNADISTRMMGYVRRLHVQPGDKVRRGALLIEINNADLAAKKAQVKANIISAEAAFANAEKDYERYKVLYQEQSASQKEMDDIDARYRMTKANLEAARQMEQEVLAQMAYVQIKAPFDAVVTNTFIKEGDMANPGMPLLGLESPEQFQVVAMVPESDIDKVKRDTEAQVHLKSLDKWISGHVSEVSSSSRNTGGQYLVKVKLKPSEADMKTGMYASVKFPLAEAEPSEQLVIPSEILVHKGQLAGVYTITEDNTALLRWLRLGRTVGEGVTVLSGLKPGETIIVAAEGKLYNGAKVSRQ